MTSINMFIPARSTCNDKRSVRMFGAQFEFCSACGWLEQQQSRKPQI
jgi:hypothetical protein